MERFLAGDTDRVAVAYMKFHSAGRQAPAVEPLLPLSPEAMDTLKRPATVPAEELDHLARQARLVPRGPPVAGAAQVRAAS